MANPLQLRLFIIVLLVLPAFLLADQLVLSNGRIYDGAVIGADDRSVSIQVSDTQLVRIPKSMVSSVFFRYADRVYLLTGEEIKCKVLDERVPELTIITENGERNLKISDLKRYFYNETDSLTISSLPPTGSVFNNQKSIGLMDTKLDQALFISLSGGAQSVSGQIWRDNFITATSLLGLQGQIQAGLSLQRDLAVYGGYLLSQYDNTAEGDLESSIQSAYLHLGVIYSRSFDFLPEAGFLVSVDAGMISLSGNLYTYSYRNIILDDQSPNIGGRILIGADSFIMTQLKLFLKTGYFFSQKFTVTIPADCSYELSLPLSGWTFLAGLSFYIPI